MKVNVLKLKGAIVGAGFTQQQISKALGMDKSTFSRKMKHDALEFSVREVHQIASLLSLNKSDLAEIFLSDNSH